MSKLEKNDRDIDWSKISDGNGNYVLWVSSSGLIFSASYNVFLHHDAHGNYAKII